MVLSFGIDLEEVAVRSSLDRSMRRIVIPIALVATVASAAVASAQVSVQTSPTLVAGDTVRVWATAPRLDGTVGALTRLDVRALTITDLYAAASPAGIQTVVPLDVLRRLDVRRGMHRSTERTIIGVVLGAAGGAVVGAALGPIIECRIDCNQSGSLQGIVGFVFGAAVGGAAGGIAGGVVGARPRPRWQPVTFRAR